MESTRCRGKCSLLELLVLAILINEGPMHGYALHKKIQCVTRASWTPSVGTLYRLLNSMAREGLVAKSGEGRRRSYSVTPAGVEYFVRNSATPLTRKAGVLATMLEALLRAAGEDAFTDDLRERLGALVEVLEKCKGLVG